MSDRVLVGMASIPERVESMRRAVRSLARQADKIAVSLNGYREVPVFLAKYPNVEPVLRGAAGGDAEKFADVDGWDGYVATCDDDLLYPNDYIARLLAGVERYERRAAVSFHGGSTEGWTHRSCAASVKRIRCLGVLRHDDEDVNVVGTGTMGWHTGHVPVWRGAFRHANMADVQMACLGHLLGLKFVCLQHRARWLVDICPPEGPRIYEANRDNLESPQNTRVPRYDELTRVDWHVPAARPKVRVSVATCSRPGKLLELLGDLDLEGRWADLEVCVYEDPSPCDYTEAREFCEQRGWGWHRFPDRFGKRGHWQLVNRQLRDAGWSRAEWFLFLPDDVRLARYTIPKAIYTWDRLDNPATLTLWRLQAFEGSASWTGRKPVPRGDATETFHVDGLYLCRRDALKVVGQIPDPGDRGEMSSGVGSYMSKQLHRRRRRMYRVDESLAVSNDDGVSIMNPADRVLYPAVAL